MAQKIPIFYYHSIGGPEPETLALRDFKLHLDLLKAKSFKTITFASLLKGDYDPEEKNAVLTFDDGLLDNYEHALPLLIEYGFIATFFVVPGFDHITRWVNPKNRKWSDIKKIGFTIPFKSMGIEQRKALITAGMEVGSHSFTHHKLNQIDPQCLKFEIADSKKYLEDELSNPIETFCYPNGRYNTQVVNTVREAGYIGATTTIPGYYNSGKSAFKTNRFLIENPLFFAEVLEGRGLSLPAYLRAKYHSLFTGSIRLENNSR